MGTLTECKLYNCRPIVIVDQPKDQFECELTQATINTNAVNGYHGKFQPTVLIGILLQTIQLIQELLRIL
jgi:hypothetical protein